MKQIEQKLRLLEQIADRKAYLVIIERDIEAVTLEGNNKLLYIKGEIDSLEREKARLMRLNFRLLQTIREHQSIVDTLVV